MTAAVFSIILGLNMHLYTESSKTRDPAGLSTTEQVAPSVTVQQLHRPLYEEDPR